MFVGCDLRPAAVAKSSKVLDSPAAQVEPGNEIRLDRRKLEPEPFKPWSEEDPVVARLITSQENANLGEAFELSVVLILDPDYEIYSLDASAPKIPTLLELELPPGFTAIDEWKSPTPVRSFNPGNESVYLGEAKFMRKIHISSGTEPGDYLLVCSVSYQACNSRQCLRPIRSVLSITMTVSP